jgi:hypothetical protein
VTLGADKAYDTKGFVERLREWNVTPHVAQNTTKRVVENGGGDEEDEISRTGTSWLDVHVRGGGLQPGEDAESGGGGRLRGAGRGKTPLPFTRKSRY